MCVCVRMCVCACVCVQSGWSESRKRIKNDGSVVVATRDITQ